MELKLNGTQQLLVYADGVNLLDDNMDVIKNTQTLIDASKEIGQEVKTEKTKYMLLSRHQNAGQNHDVKIVNRCVGNVAEVRYFETAVRDKNLIQEEIKRRLNSCNGCYTSIQKFCHRICCLET
jgi:hypothetical protein